MALAQNYGCIEPFQPEHETIMAYLKRINLYFEANDVPVAKTVVVMLNSIRAKTYVLLRSLITLHVPAEQSLTDLKDMLRGNF